MSDAVDASTWKTCSICKKTISFGDAYYACSVSTCNRARLALFFCTVQCWDAHLPEARHRDAWAEPQTAPTRQAWEREQQANPSSPSSPDADKPNEATRRRVVSQTKDDVPREILVVVSKLKAYVRARSGMNTSDGVMPVLSEHLRRVCDAAVAHAAEEGRKTLLDRDVAPVVESMRRGRGL